MANEIMIPNSGSSNDKYEVWSGVADYLGSVGLGWIKSGGSQRKVSCAIRFANVNVTAGSINYAGLYYYTQFDASDFSSQDSPSGSWDFTIKCVDEDNTANFSGGNPFGRSQTTNSETSNNGNTPTKGTWKEITVTSPVNEVMTRGGWSSGNSIALLLDPINTGASKYAGTGSASSEFKAFLVIRKDAEPNFYPTSKSVSAPTFPETDSFGIKISYPGYSVFSATENQTYFTTRKKINKLSAEGKITTTAGVTYNIAHGLPYIPFVMVYVKETGSTRRYKIPRYIPESLFQDQFASLDTTNGTVEVDSTNLKITTTSNCEVYYRIFLEDVSI